jgi:ribosomal protein L11 methylase PrmA
LTYGVTLSDASAFNVQFVGNAPVFIDVLSFRQYQKGEFWLAHRQFCEQFLNPLILRSRLGVAHNSFYRGNLEGISILDMERMLPNWQKFSSWILFSHVYMQAKLQGAANKEHKISARKAARKQLPEATFVAMLKQLRDWISKLHPKDKNKTVWADYASNHSYADDETVAKRAFVAEFVSKAKPQTVWDLGCNTGDYAQVSLDAGAQRVIGFDFDLNALDAGFRRAQKENLNFLPIFLDAANPSPSQGWNHSERMSLAERASPDALLALAFEHHIAIGRNVPLDQLLDWIVSLAPLGVIEFVPKSDPMITQMLALRDDIFPDYSEETFRAHLQDNARIVHSQCVSKAGRTLYWYDRS